MRAVLILAILSVLLACQQGERAAESQSAKIAPMPTAPPKKTVRAGQEDNHPQALNLGLPAERGGVDLARWSGDISGRYRTAEWFNAEGSKENSRLKIKSKLLLKESRDGEASLSAYADAIGGAEIGFEYKTR
ncbi:hypothetical protein [Zhongshania sp.]|uniref:hypothetical protein n=1 Tax=Zhongshania sp. TaxID=1971902 RepID=UPI00356A32E5